MPIVDVEFSGECPQRVIDDIDEFIKRMADETIDMETVGLRDLDQADGLAEIGRIYLGRGELSCQQPQINQQRSLIEKITDYEIGKMLNYLLISGTKLGLLMNFKHAKLDWKRVLLSDHRNHGRTQMNTDISPGDPCLLSCVRG